MVLLQVDPALVSKGANSLMDTGVMGIMFVLALGIISYFFKAFFAQSKEAQKEIRELNDRVQEQNKQQQEENKNLEKEFRDFLREHVVQSHVIIRENTQAFKEFTKVMNQNIEINHELINLISFRLDQLEEHE